MALVMTDSIISIYREGIQIKTDDGISFIPKNMISGVFLSKDNKSLDIYAVNPKMSCFLRNMTALEKDYDAIISLFRNENIHFCYAERNLNEPKKG